MQNSTFNKLDPFQFFLDFDNHSIAVTQYTSPEDGEDYLYNKESKPVEAKGKICRIELSSHSDEQLFKLNLHKTDAYSIDYLIQLIDNTLSVNEQSIDKSKLDSIYSPQALEFSLIEETYSKDNTTVETLYAAYASLPHIKKLIPNFEFFLYLFPEKIKDLLFNPEKIQHPVLSSYIPKQNTCGSAPFIIKYPICQIEKENNEITNISITNLPYRTHSMGMNIIRPLYEYFNKHFNNFPTLDIFLTTLNNNYDEHILNDSQKVRSSLEGHIEDHDLSNLQLSKLSPETQKATTVFYSILVEFSRKDNFKLPYADALSNALDKIESSKKIRNIPTAVMLEYCDVSQREFGDSTYSLNNTFSPRTKVFELAKNRYMQFHSFHHLKKEASSYKLLEEVHNKFQENNLFCTQAQQTLENSQNIEQTQTQLSTTAAQQLLPTQQHRRSIL